MIKSSDKVAGTAAYYQNNANAYCDETYALNADHLYPPFLELLDEGAHILDLGCGSGRDSEQFIKAGYKVTPMDGSAEIAAYAEQLLGQKVSVNTFQEMTFTEEFDGVWASASLLHCPRKHIPNVLKRIHSALKLDGIAYLSFKWGEEDTVDDRGRAFTNYTLDSLKQELKQCTKFEVLNMWQETTPLRGREQKWVNALLKKVCTAR